MAQTNMIAKTNQLKQKVQLRPEVTDHLGKRAESRSEGPYYLAGEHPVVEMEQEKAAKRKTTKQ